MNDSCGICQGARGPSLRICTDCISPIEVRTFCRRCRERVSLTEAEVGTLISLLGVDLKILPGTTIVFLKRCPLCRVPDEPGEYPQRFMTISA